MIVCHCMGVSDRWIRRAVRHGARTVDEVSEACGAGTVCTGCHPQIEILIEDTRAREIDRAGPAGADREREEPGGIFAAPLSADPSPAR